MFRAHAFAAGAVTLLIAMPAMAQTTRSAPPDASGPQTVVPPPAPGNADVPGGSASNGVIKPPTTQGGMPVITPPATSNTPVLRPPGSDGNLAPGQPKVQPK